MQDHNIKNIRDLMLCNREVKQLTEQARHLHDLNHILHNFMPSMLIQFCKIKHYEYGNLKLEAATGSAAAQLRFLQPQLFNKLKSHPKFSALQTLSITVGSPTAQDLSRRYVKTAPPASEDNCALLHETASAITDKGLAEAMENLANTLANRNKKT